MAGPFPLYTDADVHQPLVESLRERGWDVIRAMEVIANRWLKEGRAFRGLVLWPQQHYKRMGFGDLVEQLEALEEPFPHPVIHLKPRR